MSSNDQPSTLKSYVDSAAGAIQSGIASITGNPGDQVSSTIEFPAGFSSRTVSLSHNPHLVPKPNSNNIFLTLHHLPQAKADQTRSQASAEHTASEAAVKAGPFTLSSTGAATKDNPDRSHGAWDQTVGSGKETLGNLVGNENLKREGREQNLQGQGQEAKGQLADFGEGVTERVKGSVGGAVAGLTGTPRRRRR